MAYYVAVDIGGTNMRAALFSAEGLVPLRRGRTPTRGPQRPQARLVALLQHIWPQEGRVVRIGVASPGPLDPVRGVILRTPNIPEWQNFPLADHLRAIFGVAVTIDNDANLAALAEWRYGAGRGHDHLLYITVSTGVGAGVIVGGRLLHGARGLAGELGHVAVVADGPRCGCGQHGHLEALASGTAIARRAQEALAAGEKSSLAGLPAPPTATAVARAARAGDALASRIMAEAAGHLGRALAGFLHVFNPEVVVLGGGVIQAGRIFLQPLENTLRREVMHSAYLENLTLTTSALGEDAGLLGALTLARAKTVY